jgi:N-acetylglucosaminyldiphosphoundecaprenol N-acetyl-beta-D-mannosaminyltransferase
MSCPGDAGSSPLVSVIDLAGLPLAKLSRHAVVDHVFTRIERGEGGWIVTPNLDYARRYVADPAMRRLFAGASLIVADGVPLLWAARLQGTPLPDRVAGSDLVWLLAERAAREGRSLYLLGGNPGVGEQARQRLIDRSPTLRVVGVSSPRVSAQPSESEIASIRAEIERSRPDIVYVGLGAPKEERLIAALRPTFPGSWWIGVGVSLSFIAGDVVRAPRWVQRMGLEWLHRLVQEPGRLGRRYLVDGLPFAIRLLTGSLWRRWTTRRELAAARAPGSRNPDA